MQTTDPAKGKKLIVNFSHLHHLRECFSVWLLAEEIKEERAAQSTRTQIFFSADIFFLKWTYEPCQRHLVPQND